ncbi:MAG: histidine kinase dimerization/phosphoacceptor domain-containing protein [Galbitalea sp.]
MDQAQERARARESHRGRLLFPVIFSLIVQLPSVFFTFDPPHRPIRLHLVPEQFWLAFTFAVLGPLALLGARRFPGPVVAIVSVSAVIDLFVVGPDTAPVYIALAFAIFGAIVRGARVWAWISVGSAWIASLVVSFILGSNWTPAAHRGDDPRHPRRLRHRRVRANPGGALRADRQDSCSATTERGRGRAGANRPGAPRRSRALAQPDQCAVRVGLHLMDSQPEKAREALASIKETSKSALDEVRSVLGVLRAGGAVGEDAPLVPRARPEQARLARGDGQHAGGSRSR